MIDAICSYISYHTDIPIDMTDYDSPYLHYEVCKKMVDGAIMIRDNKMMIGFAYNFNVNDQRYNIHFSAKKIQRTYCPDLLSNYKKNKVPSCCGQANYAYNPNVMMPYTSVFFRPSNTHVHDAYAYVPSFNIDLAHKDTISIPKYLQIIHNALIYGYNEVFGKFFIEQFKESSFDIEYHKALFNASELRINEYIGKPYVSMIIKVPTDKILNFVEFGLNMLPETTVRNQQAKLCHEMNIERTKNLIIKVNMFPFEHKMVVMDMAYYSKNYDRVKNKNIASKYIMNYEHSYENSEESITSALSNIVCDMLYNTAKENKRDILLKMMKDGDEEEVLNYVKYDMIPKAKIHTFKDMRFIDHQKIMFANLFNDLLVSVRNRDTNKKYALITNNGGKTVRPIYTIYALPYVKASYLSDSSNQNSIEQVYEKRLKSTTEKEKTKHTCTLAYARAICNDLSDDLTKIFREVVDKTYELFDPKFYEFDPEIVKYVKSLNKKKDINIFVTPLVGLLDNPLNVSLYWSPESHGPRFSYTDPSDLTNYDIWILGRKFGSISIDDDPANFVNSITISDIYNGSSKYGASKFIAHMDIEKKAVSLSKFLSKYIVGAEDNEITKKFAIYSGIVNTYKNYTHFKKENPFIKFSDILKSNEQRITLMIEKYCQRYKEVHEKLANDTQLKIQMEKSKRLQKEAKQAYIDNVRRPIEQQTNETSLETCHSIASFITQAQYYTDCKLLHVPFVGSFQQIDDDMSDDI